MSGGTGSDDGETPRREALVVPGTYKVRGLIEADATNGSRPTGVLGRASGSGTTFGVAGVVDSAEGYGVYTPDDARVDGTLTAGATRTETLEVLRTLPKYDAVGDDPQRVVDAMGMLFDSPAWADGNYRDGDGHAETAPAFHGATLAPTGEVVFVPYDAANVGVYDPATDTYTSGPSHGEGVDAFGDAALAPSGEFVFAPNDSTHVGEVDTGAQTHKPRMTALHPLVNNS